MLELDIGAGDRQARDLSAQQPGGMTMELRPYFPTITNVRQLEQGGFSSEQIANLLRVKALYQQGVYHEDSPEQKRLEFIRWLYLQGRLQS